MAYDTSKIRIIVNLTSRAADKMHNNKAQSNNDDESNEKFEKGRVKHDDILHHYCTILTQAAKLKMENGKKLCPEIF